MSSPKKKEQKNPKNKTKTLAARINERAENKSGALWAIFAWSVLGRGSGVGGFGREQFCGVGGLGIEQFCGRARASGGRGQKRAGSEKKDFLNI